MTTNPTNGQSGEVARALLEAQKSIGALGFDRRNAFAKYDYVSSEKMVAAAKEALNGAGLTLTTLSSSLFTSAGHAFDAKPEHAPRTEFFLSVVYCLAHGDSGQTLCLSQVWPIVPAKGKTLDKAVGGAYTTALSYFLRGLLLIPRTEKGDDMNDTEAQPAPRGAPARTESSGDTVTIEYVKERLGQTSNMVEVRALWEQLVTPELQEQALPLFQEQKKKVEGGGA